MEDKYKSQKKHLSNKKQLRVWFDEDDYNEFKEVVERKNESIYSVIHKLVSEYVNNNK
nr:MAG TPA: Transcriptional regulator, RHH-like, CopG [Bacteriophage sp.]